MEKYAVIVAGGSGSRMGAQIPKQFLLLQNKPVLWYTLTAFLDAFSDLKIILVLPGQYFNEGREIIESTYDPSRIKITAGGETRFNSVKNGLEHVPVLSVVFVHDGVRCLVTPALIQRCYNKVLEKGNAVPSVKPADSIRIITEEGNKTLERNDIRIIQTPQAFRGDLIKKAFNVPYHPSFTDEASVVEHAGEKINLVEGEITNIKITLPIDLYIAGKVLEERKINP